VQSDLTDFTLALTRSEGTPAPAVSVAGSRRAPRRASTRRTRWPATSTVMTIETTEDTPVGEYDLTVTANADGTTSSTAVTLAVTQLRPFTIAGDVVEPLTLGATRTVPLTLTNPYDFDLVVEELDVRATTTKAGCDADANFAVAQPDLGDEPLVLPPGDSELSELVGADQQPTVTWQNLETEQNACLGAPLTFTYSGLARKR
jgi:hypothetical protein